MARSEHFLLKSEPETAVGYLCNCNFCFPTMNSFARHIREIEENEKSMPNETYTHYLQKSDPDEEGYTCNCWEHFDTFAEYGKHVREIIDMSAPRMALNAASQPRAKSERFHELLQKCGELYSAKQADYGRDDDPFANVRASEEWGIAGWVGALIRLNDKVRRLQKLAQGKTLKNESIEDSLLDIANYALISLVLLEEESQSR